MTFPDTKHDGVAAFAEAYFERSARAQRSVDRAALARAADMIGAAIAADATLFACGNGGSAAIANHLLCDYAKGVQTDTGARPRAVSLSAGTELITAIANDIAYADVFVYQLRTAARPGDVLLTISASGDSENVVRALAWARENGIGTIAMTGFGGGRSGALADVNLHVAGDNYGIVEDAHHALIHILTQYLRLERMEAGLVRERRF